LKGFNGEGLIDVLRGRATEEGIPLTETIKKIKKGYVGKPKSGAQILFERGFINKDGKMSDGRKLTMNGTSSRDHIIDVQLILTPKCHPEIAGRGVEYDWGYSKMRFRSDFNDTIAANLCSAFSFIRWMQRVCCKGYN